MVDSIGIGSLIAAWLNWLEARKHRRLMEAIVWTPPVGVKRKRRARRKGRSNATGATRLVAEQRRERRLQLEREEFEWTRTRDFAKGVAWVLEYIRDRDAEDDDYNS